jgi:hypothetical protein
MKKKSIYFGLLSTLVLALSFMLPIVAADSPCQCGWSTMPFTDTVNDVYQYNFGDSPWQGVKVATHDDIDIQVVDFSGNNLIIEFCATPGITTQQYSIYFDTNSDGTADYALSCTTGAFYAVRISDYTYWNGTGWDLWAHKAAISHSISGNNLTIQNVNVPISGFTSAKVAVAVGDTVDYPVLYSDYAPLDPSGGIPGFPWLITLFSILTLMSLVLLRQKDKISL